MYIEFSSLILVPLFSWIMMKNKITSKILSSINGSQKDHYSWSKDWILSNRILHDNWLFRVKTCFCGIKDFMKIKKNLSEFQEWRHQILTKVVFLVTSEEKRRYILLLVNWTGFRSGIGPPPATSYTGQNSEMFVIKYIHCWSMNFLTHLRY